MERFEKSPRNQVLYEQHKIERKLRKQELRQQGIKLGPKPHSENHEPRERLRAVRDCTPIPGEHYFEQDFYAGIHRRFEVVIDDGELPY